MELGVLHLKIKMFLSDLRDIAAADGRLNSNEKHLHDKIAKELGINVILIDKNTRKNLSTKYEKRIHS